MTRLLHQLPRELHLLRPFRPLPLRRLYTTTTTTTTNTTLPPPLAAAPIVPSPLSPKTTDAITHLSSLPHRRPTLSDLVRFGPPPLTTPQLLASARLTRELIPRRLARRILALRNLPYIIVTNPHINSIFQNYVHSFEALSSLPSGDYPRNLDEESEFAQVLGGIVRTHNNTIPILAKGFQECGSQFMRAEEITAFLERHLRARIGTRLLAEQHLALHAATFEAGSPAELTPGVNPDHFIGIIDTRLSPTTILRRSEAFVAEICELRYGDRPRLEIDGEVEGRCAYIPMHMEYIFTELLKNSFRASIESALAQQRMNAGLGIVGRAAELEIPVVKATIALAEGGKWITIRIRDRGGGISPSDLREVWNYSFTTFNQDTGEQEDFNELVNGALGGSSIAGLGYGLPLSRAYAEYFGGSMELQSAFGWGTDVYLKLKGLVEPEGGYERQI
ncbi:alpha-ketoacid dehydrogenase kinase [Ascobolus immersus RN42]|uniref:Protein-serine/threonine kinase n=1 Tax=Ascobolus immersus RN42 TaxID=1160509 RepID=A0A3N4IBG9_ASCIM|nr:alpha-ketoacid dehydrogenase kinase [Ascobolus immersus RN42]